MGERVYEGRGEGLSDARMSWIDGAAADDMRLSGLHFRLLAHIGRQNARRGWLRLSQTELAEVWDVARGSINRAVSELVEWGYILKRSQRETGEAFCTYRTRLDGDDAPPPPAVGRGVSRTDYTPHVSHTGDTGVTSTHTGVSPLESQNRLSPTIADPPPPTPAQPSRAAGEGDCGNPGGEQGTAGGEPAAAPQPRFTARWDRPAREALAHLAGSATRAHVADMIAAVCGTLHPPSEVDGASWVRQAAAKLGGHPAPVLGELADRIIAKQKRDVPPVGVLAEWAAEIAARHAVRAADAAQSRQRERIEAETLARLAPGVEPDAAPQRRDAIDLRRAFVATIVGGAALDHAWLGSLLVLDRTGPRLVLSAESPMIATYVASSNLAHQVQAAARTLWPQVRTVECRVHAAVASPAASARPEGHAA